MQSMGAVEKTVDREYEDEEKRYRNFESKVNRLAAEVRGTLDSTRGADSPGTRPTNEDFELILFVISIAVSHYHVAKVVCRGHRSVLRQLIRNVLCIDGVQEEGH